MANTFNIGQTYTTRSICDYDTIFSFKVVARTKKFITLDYHGEERRVGVKTNEIGNEWALPLGSYSMAPIIRA